MRLFLFVFLAAFAASALVRADRPATSQEAKAIRESIAAEGCKGGTYKVDQQNGAVLAYRVLEARCPNGVIMNFSLDPAFLVQSMDRQD